MEMQRYWWKMTLEAFETCAPRKSHWSTTEGFLSLLEKVVVITDCYGSVKMIQFSYPKIARMKKEKGCGRAAFYCADLRVLT